jgi:hypothetical protein
MSAFAAANTPTRRCVVFVGKALFNLKLPSVNASAVARCENLGT